MWESLQAVENLYEFEVLFFSLHIYNLHFANVDKLVNLCKTLPVPINSSAGLKNLYLKKTSDCNIIIAINWIEITPLIGSSPWQPLCNLSMLWIHCFVAANKTMLPVWTSIVLVLNTGYGKCWGYEITLIRLRYNTQLYMITFVVLGKHGNENLLIAPSYLCTSIMMLYNINCREGAAFNEQPQSFTFKSFNQIL